MNAEHVAGHRRDLVVKFLSECEKSREALAFSRRSVQQMEDRDAEDWTQVLGPCSALVCCEITAATAIVIERKTWCPVDHVDT